MTSVAMRSKIAIRTRLGLLSIDVLDLVVHGDLAMQYRKYNGGSGVIFFDAFLAPLAPWAAPAARSLPQAQGVSLDKHSPYGPIVKVQDKHLPSVDRLAMALPSLSLHMQSCKLLGFRGAWLRVFSRNGRVDKIARSNNNFTEDVRVV